ncbi:MAG: hypothetical protein ACR2PZ_19755 [Pseudomonadales bacterium]
MSKFTIPEQKQSTEDTEPRLEFRFLLSGANHSDAARLSLQDELNDLLEQVVHLNLLPVNQGLQLDLEVASIAPFALADYEAYLIDHILAPAISKVATHEASSVRIQPLRSRRA